MSTSSTSSVSSTASSFLSSNPLRPFALKHLQRNLRILRFEDGVGGIGGIGGIGGVGVSGIKGEREKLAAILEDPALFSHSDAASFQQIIHFLLHVLDPSLASSTFRDVWPVLERKQEAEFRKKVFNAYKEIQSNNKDQLPIVNVSLLQTPGGKKFINFLYELSQFAVKQQIEKLKKKHKNNQQTLNFNPRSLNDEEDLEPLKKLLKIEIEDNSKEVKKAEDETVRVKREAIEFVEENSETFRQLKVRERQLDEDFQSRLLSAKEERLKRGNEKELDSVEELKQECSEIKSKHDSLLEQTRAPLESISDSLKRIDSIIHPETVEEPNFVDVSKITTVMGDDTLPKLVDRLLRIVDSNMVEKMVELPKDDVESTRLKIVRHLQGMEEKERKISQELLPEVTSSIRALEKNDKIANIEIDPKLLPKPLPPVRINFHNKSNTNRFSLSLKDITKKKTNKAEPSEDNKEPLKTDRNNLNISRIFMPPLPNSEFNDEESFLQKRPRQTNNLNSDSAGTRLTSHSTYMFSQPRNPISSDLQTSSRTLITSNEDYNESKLSVFSPILSSSRMESTASSDCAVHSHLNLSAISELGGSGDKQHSKGGELSPKSRLAKGDVESPKMKPGMARINYMVEADPWLKSEVDKLGQTILKFCEPRGASSSYRESPKFSHDSRMSSRDLPGTPTEPESKRASCNSGGNFSRFRLDPIKLSPSFLRTPRKDKKDKPALVEDVNESEKKISSRFNDLMSTLALNENDSSVANTSASSFPDLEGEKIKSKSDKKISSKLNDLMCSLALNTSENDTSLLNTSAGFPDIDLNI